MMEEKVKKYSFNPVYIPYFFESPLIGTQASGLFGFAACHDSAALQRKSI